MLSEGLRSQLVQALRDDLIGPDADDPGDTAHPTESLSSSPAHGYRTGFLAPTGQATEGKADPEAGEELDAAVEGPERRARPTRPSRAVASLGLRV